jgi:hypothetical protein
MARDSKLISTDEANRLLKAGEAVRSGTVEHHQMMAGLWEKVAKQLIFVVTANAWFYRSLGADRTPLRDHAAQTKVDLNFSSERPVLSWGRSDGRVKLTYEAPQLADVANPILHKTLRGHLRTDEQGFTALQRMVVDFMDTYPGKESIVVLDGSAKVWNMWSPPEIRPITLMNYQEPKWFLDVVDRFFGEHEKEREYFLDWCTHLICRPDVKMPVSVLLVSSLTGAGKGFIADALKHMVGTRNYKNITSGTLKGGFQSFVMGTTLAVVNELYEQGNYGFADSLKTWQSEESQFINIKYGPQQNTKNMVHFLTFSNRSSAIVLDEEDRRWFTFESPEKEAMSAEWWSDKWKYLKNPETRLPHTGALGSLRRWFDERMIEIELTGRFQPFARPPETEHKRSLIEDSRTTFYLRVKELLDEGSIPVMSDGLTTLRELETSLATNGGFKSPPNAQITQDLQALGFTQVRKKTGRFWALPVGYEPRETYEPGGMLHI